MKGYQQPPMNGLPASVITDDGARHFADGSSQPPGSYSFPPPPPFVLGTPIQVDYINKPPVAETPAQSGTIAVGEPNPGKPPGGLPLPPPIYQVQGYKQTDGSIIFPDGSRKYLDGKLDPPATWTWPPHLGALGDSGVAVTVTVGGGKGTVITPGWYGPSQGQGPPVVVNEPPVAQQGVDMPVDPKLDPNGVYVIWCGPVAALQVPGASLPGAKTDFLQCTGSGTPTCGEIASAMSNAMGRILPSLLSRVGDPPDAKPWAAAFSAGGQIWKKVMMNPQDRFQLDGYIAADAGFEAGWANEKQGLGLSVTGYVLFAADCFADKRVFVWTASSNPNPSVQNPGTIYPSGAQTMAATMADIETRTGVKFVDVTSDPTAYPWSAVTKPPRQVWRYENVIFADYGANYSHEDHAKVLAAAVFASIPQIVAEPTATAPAAGTDAPTVALGYLDRVKAWWDGASTTTKGVTAAVGVAGVYAVASRKKG